MFREEVTIFLTFLLLSFTFATGTGPPEEQNNLKDKGKGIDLTDDCDKGKGIDLTDDCDKGKGIDLIDLTDDCDKGKGIDLTGGRNVSSHNVQQPQTERLNMPRFYANSHAPPPAHGPMRRIPEPSGLANRTPYSRPNEISRPNDLNIDSMTKESIVKLREKYEDRVYKLLAVINGVPNSFPQVAASAEGHNFLQECRMELKELRAQVQKLKEKEAELEAKQPPAPALPPRPTRARAWAQAATRHSPIASTAPNEGIGHPRPPVLDQSTRQGLMQKVSQDQGNLAKFSFQTMDPPAAAHNQSQMPEDTFTAQANLNRNYLYEQLQRQQQQKQHQHQLYLHEQQRQQQQQQRINTLLRHHALMNQQPENDGGMAPNPPNYSYQFLLDSVVPPMAQSSMVGHRNAPSAGGFMPAQASGSQHGLDRQQHAQYQEQQFPPFHTSQQPWHSQVPMPNPAGIGIGSEGPSAHQPGIFGAEPSSSTARRPSVAASASISANSSPQPHVASNFDFIAPPQVPQQQAAVPEPGQLRQQQSNAPVVETDQSEAAQNNHYEFDPNYVPDGDAIERFARGGSP